MGRPRCLQAVQGEHGSAIVAFKCASHAPRQQYDSKSGASRIASRPHLGPPRAPQAWNSIVLHHETHIPKKRPWAPPGRNCANTTRIRLGVVLESYWTHRVWEGLWDRKCSLDVIPECQQEWPGQPCGALWRAKIGDQMGPGPQMMRFLACVAGAMRPVSLFLKFLALRRRAQSV